MTPLERRRRKLEAEARPAPEQPPTGPACALCGVAGAAKRCAQCRAVWYCSPEHQRQHWKQHKPSCARQPAGPIRLGCAKPVGALLVQAIREQGYAVIQLPQSCAGRLGPLEAACRQFFGQGQSEKDRFRTAALHGYMTPAPAVHEVFEVRPTSWDPEYRLPPDGAARIQAGFGELRQVGLDCLGAISGVVCGDERRLGELLEIERDWSTMRLLHYDRLHTKELSEAQQAMPAHSDSSVLTVAPKGSHPGLKVRRFSDGQLVEVEAGLAPDQAVLFAGDLLSVMLSHYLPALLHYPCVESMLGQAEQSGIFRVSTPLFLRPSGRVRLNPSQVPMVQPVLDKLEYGQSDADFTVEELDNNERGVRFNVPWRRAHPYYCMPLLT